jgi:hypothetical protein
MIPTQKERLSRIGRGLDRTRGSLEKKNKKRAA